MSTPEQIAAIESKSANVGTFMYRRSDVRSWIFKFRARYVKALRDAEKDNNSEWRANAVLKLRLINEMQEGIETTLPVFENGSDVEETRTHLEARQ